MARAYVGLGANLGDRGTALQRAFDRLAAQPGVELVGVLAFRETEPFGIRDQPRFLYVVASLET